MAQSVRTPIKEVVGVWALDWLVCIWKACSLLFGLSKNWLTLGEAIPLVSARPQISKHQTQKLENIVNYTEASEDSRTWTEIWAWLCSGLLWELRPPSTSETQRGRLMEQGTPFPKDWVPACQQTASSFVLYLHSFSDVYNILNCQFKCSFSTLDCF